MDFASKSVFHENPLGRHTEDFPDARKIQRLRPGLNPRTGVPVASMLTARPPKPSYMQVKQRSGCIKLMIVWLVSQVKALVMALLVIQTK